MTSKALSFNEIRSRLDAFVHEFKDDTSENAEAHTFWEGFLRSFGVERRRVASFERRATRASTGRTGRIDLFWPKVLLGEMKSRGAMKGESADVQAEDYLAGGDVSPTEWPRFIITCDFETMRLTDLDEPDAAKRTKVFAVAKLRDHVEDLAFLAGYTARSFTTDEEVAVSIRAAQMMGTLYEALTGDADTDVTIEDEAEEEDATQRASILLTRILFLLFGDDAGLWERDLFKRFLEERTASDGSDLGGQLSALFDVLNTPEGRRSNRMDALLARFPYVNGGIFSSREPVPYFDSKMREVLLVACNTQWSDISPAIFGSLFQTIKSKEARRATGEHYTTEENILKLVEPLFLDEVRLRLRQAWNSKAKLRALHDEFAHMRYMDPACGCGNFLIVAYRQMRRLELDLLVRLRELEGTAAELTLDATWDLKVSLNQFYGIEIAWWPAKIAETAMFLVDHQANREMALALGGAPDRLPIKITPHIHHDNALTVDWRDVMRSDGRVLVFGNPPFLGHATRDEDQAAELRAAWGTDDISRLDYVTGWHAQALKYLGDLRTARWAFVTTSSITQGDPVPHLFKPIRNAGWQVKFAHRTFAWSSEAARGAAVHCVIIGFTRDPAATPRLFDYATPKAEPHEVKVKRINPYLVDGPDVYVEKRSKPLSPVLSEVVFGAMARDDGNLIVEPADYDEVAADPIAAKYLRRFVQAKELVHDNRRWCLWLVHLDPADVAKSPVLRERLDAVRAFRAASKAGSTRGMAATPHLFGQRPAVDSVPFVCIPRHVSENRRYFTVARFGPEVICGDANFLTPDPDGFLFAVLSSSMFITWQRTVGGRLESRLRFSNTIVWNNLPLPHVSSAVRGKIIAAGHAVEAARALHLARSLADHYNPLAMDPRLIKAHDALDRLVDKAFGAPTACKTQAERQAVLFARFAEMTAV